IDQLLDEPDHAIVVAWHAAPLTPATARQPALEALRPTERPPGGPTVRPRAPVARAPILDYVDAIRLEMAVKKTPEAGPRQLTHMGGVVNDDVKAVRGLLTGDAR